VGEAATLDQSGTQQQILPLQQTDVSMNDQSSLLLVATEQWAKIVTVQKTTTTPTNAVPAQLLPSQEQPEHAGNVADQTNSAANFYPVG
jgi:hypothetical protein